MKWWRPALEIAWIGFTGVATFVSVRSELGVWTPLAFALCFLVGLIYVGIRYYRSVFTLRTEFAATREQLENAYVMGQKVYVKLKAGQHYPEMDVVAKWCEKYPYGVIQMRYGKGPPLAYLSIWPVTEAGFTELKTGSMPEARLESNIESAKEPPFRRWYIADVCNIDPIRKKRRQGAQKPKEFAGLSAYLHEKMVVEAFELLLSQKQLADRFEVLAFGVTRPGKKLLSSWAFRELKPTSQTPLYPDIRIKAYTEETVKYEHEKFRHKYSRKERTEYLKLCRIHAESS